ncbi:hypothetical protein CR513_19114, partial [Mucuna pruriens]
MFYDGLITSLKWKSMLTHTLGVKGAMELFWEWVLNNCRGDTPRLCKWYHDSLTCASGSESEAKAIRGDRLKETSGLGPIPVNHRSLRHGGYRRRRLSYSHPFHDRMLKELAKPDVVHQPWCIEYPQLELAQSYELKSSLIHLLPKFHGLAGEDPHKHLKEFHVVCSTMRPQGIPEDYIKMKVFPFSLDEAAKDWLYLQLVLFNT